MLADFQDSFTAALSSKFAVLWSSEGPVYLKQIATSPSKL